MTPPDSSESNKWSIREVFRIFLTFFLVTLSVCLILLLVLYDVIVRGSQPTKRIPTTSIQTIKTITTLSPDSININLPAKINSGENIQLTIQFTNPGTEDVNILRVDVSINVLNGFAIESTSPKFYKTNQFEDAKTGEDFKSFYFNAVISPSTTYTIAFNGKALLAGNYHGTINICVHGKELICNDSVFRIIIQ